jgi:hypothetical protein
LTSLISWWMIKSDSNTTILHQSIINTTCDFIRRNNAIH